MVFQYLELNSMAIAVVLILLFNMRKSRRNMLDEKIFFWILITNIGILVCDTIGWLSPYMTSTAGRILCIWADTFYFLLSVLAAFLWMLYTDFRLAGKETELWHRSLYYGIPLAINTMLSLATPYTGWYFTLDEAGVYYRGPLFVVQVCCGIGLLLCATCFSIYLSYGAVSRASKTECYILASFTILPGIGSMVQTVFSLQSPLMWLCTSLALLIIYMNIQNSQISVDALTGLNNRGKFDRYLEAKVSGYSEDLKLFLVMMDVDKFKQINDRFGHAVGDEALISVAEILKKSCSGTGDFIARLGGDEFVVVSQYRRRQEMEAVITTINREIAMFNVCSGAPYQISISMGIAEYGAEGVDSLEALMMKADNEMYRCKKSKR